MVQYISTHILTPLFFPMGLGDNPIDSNLRGTPSRVTATPARALGPIVSLVLGWSPVLSLGMAIGFGMSMVLAEGLSNTTTIPGGAPMSSPETGMVRAVAYIPTSEERPSWLAAPAQELQHTAAPVETTPQPFEEETPAVTAPVETSAVRADNKVGVYLTASSIARTKFFNETMDDIVASGGSSIVFDVKGSRVYFHSAAPAATEMGLVQPVYDLPAVIAAAHERGLFVIGRLVAIKDDGITGKRPDTRVRDPEGKRVLSQGWVDPSNELAVRYNAEVICELAQAGIDEINLDYIRFSTADFGALRVYSGQEKADKVEVFIKASREAIDRCGPQTKLGLSTYAILGWNYPNNVETLGQDVVRFAKYVDIISPMAYPATFTSNGYYAPGKHPRSRMYWLVYRTLTGYQELLGPEDSKKLRPWIQGYGVTKRDMREQMDAVYAAGLCGFQVWNANNNYKPVYDTLETEATRPEYCGGSGQTEDIAGMNW